MLILTYEDLTKALSAYTGGKTIKTCRWYYEGKVEKVQLIFDSDMVDDKIKMSFHCIDCDKDFDSVEAVCPEGVGHNVHRISQ